MKEKVTPTEVREIQPVIYREVEVVEIRRIIQPIYERSEMPVTTEEIIKAAEQREETSQG